jgi:hypothetical protein
MTLPERTSALCWCRLEGIEMRGIPLQMYLYRQLDEAERLQEQWNYKTAAKCHTHSPANITFSILFEANE